MSFLKIFGISVHFFILFGGGLAWLLALGQLTLEYRNSNNYLATAYFFFLGIWQFLGGCVFLGVTDSLRFNIFVVTVPCFFISVPLLYFYFKCVIDSQFRFQPAHLLHLLPPLLSALILLPFAYQKIDLYGVMNFLTYSEYKSSEVLISLVMYSAMLLYTGYLVSIGRQTYAFYNQVLPDRKSYFRIIFYTILFLIVLDSWWFIDRVFSLGFPQVTYACVTILLVSVYLLSNRYPEFLLEIKMEAERVTYVKSQVVELDSNNIVQTIETVMIEEKAFCDTGISLGSLADRLNITPHQLSEIVNQKFELNFSSLVNRYRIQEAQRILLADLDRKILAVAYDVGFNSPSAFYNAFQKTVGLSPSRYRKENPPQ